MTTQCPHCGSSFTVDDALAGRQVRCTQCENLFTITAPAAPDASGPLTLVPGSYDRASRAPARRPGVTPLVLMLIGAFALTGAFATPWWKETVTPAPERGPDELTREQTDHLRHQRDEVDRENEEFARWRLRHRIDRRLDSARWDFDRRYPPRRSDDAVSRTGRSYTVYVWGPQCTAGVLGLVFGSLIVLWSILSLAVDVIQRWSWTGSFVCVGLSVPMVVLGLLWTFATPHLDVMDEMSRGAFVGSFMSGGGGLLVFIAALTDAVGGLARVVSRRRY